MASFTDQIPNFTPYIQQLPVDAYVTTGMALQGQYTMGLQRAQAEVDKVANLDIAKEPTKKYLESKLAEMKQALGRNISGDFSDSRLNNQIGSATAQIANDPIIENGVISTANYRRGVADNAQAKKDGKHGIENEWDFSSKASAWLNDGDHTTSFDASYVPYRDVNKKILEAIKAVDPDSEILQQPYVTDSYGTVQRDANGSPIFNYQLLEEHYKGKDAQKIKEAVYATLDAGDWQQLSISGRYTYKDATPDQLKQTIDLKYRDKKLSIANALAEKKIEAGLSSLPASRKEQLQKEIKEYEGMLGTKGKPGKIDQGYIREIQTLQENPDAIKASIYSDNYVDRISRAFSSEERWKKYLDNPGFNNVMELNKYNQDAEQWQQDYNLKLKTEERLSTELNLKLMGKLGPDGKPIEGRSTEGAPLGVDATYKDPTQLTFQSDVDMMKTTFYAGLEGVVQKLAPEAYAEWKKNVIAHPEVGDIAGAENLKQAFLYMQYQKMKDMWQDSPNSIDPSLQKTVMDLIELEREVEEKQVTLNTIVKNKTEEVNTQRVAEGKTPVMDYSQIVASLEGTRVPIIKGIKVDKIVDVSAQDMLDFALTLVGSSEDKERAKTKLKSKFGDNFSDIRVGLMGGDAIFASSNPSMIKAIRLVKSEGFKQVQEKVTSAIKEGGYVPKPTTRNITVGKGEQRSEVKGNIEGVLNRIEDAGGSGDLKDIRSVISTDDNWNASVEWVPSVSKFGDGKWKLIVNGERKKGKPERIAVDIPQEDASLLTGVQYNTPYSRIIERLKYSPTGSTSYQYPAFAPLAHTDAFLTTHDFPNVVKSEVKANVAVDESKKNDTDIMSQKYYLYLYKKNEEGQWETRIVRPPGAKPGEALRADQLEMLAAQLTDAHIADIFAKQ